MNWEAADIRSILSIANPLDLAANHATARSVSSPAAVRAFFWQPTVRGLIHPCRTELLKKADFDWADLVMISGMLK